MANLCEAALSILGQCFQPFSCRGPLFAETMILGLLHEKFVSELMTRPNYGDETIRTLTISSGTRDPKSQPCRHTAKSKRASATAGALYLYILKL